MSFAPIGSLASVYSWPLSSSSGAYLSLFRTQDWEKANTSWRKHAECRVDLGDLRYEPLEVTMEGMDCARNEKNVDGEVRQFCSRSTAAIVSLNCGKHSARGKSRAEPTSQGQRSLDIGFTTIRTRPRIARLIPQIECIGVRSRCVVHVGRLLSNAEVQDHLSCLQGGGWSAKFLPLFREAVLDRMEAVAPARGMGAGVAIPPVSVCSLGSAMRRGPRLRPPRHTFVK